MFDFNSLLYALQAARGMGMGAGSSTPSMRPPGVEGPLMQSGQFHGWEQQPQQPQPQQQQSMPFLPMSSGGGGGGVAGGMSGAAQGAASGASTGMMFGPWGAVIGGVLGAALGGVKGSKKPPTPAPPPAMTQDRPRVQLKPTADTLLAESLMNANSKPTMLPPQMSLDDIKKYYNLYGA